MAIYHFSVKTISRGDGRSAVACAAYRSGQNLLDEQQNKQHDYTKKQGVEFTKIYAPDNTNSALLDRQTLWNAVEKTERRKDSNLAREFEVALPCELNSEQRLRLLDELCHEIVQRHAVVVDAAIHAPHMTKNSAGNHGDNRNYHAHVLFTGRQIDPQTGEFAKKRNRDFNLENSKKTVTQWREIFADMTNKHLELAGKTARVSHFSYADLGNDLTPTIHEGPTVTQLRRQGVSTRISQKNDETKKYNARIRQQQKVEIEDDLIDLRASVGLFLPQEQLKAAKLAEERRTAAKKLAEETQRKQCVLQQELKHAWQQTHEALLQLRDDRRELREMEHLPTPHWTVPLLQYGLPTQMEISQYAHEHFAWSSITGINSRGDAINFIREVAKFQEKFDLPIETAAHFYSDALKITTDDGARMVLNATLTEKAEKIAPPVSHRAQVFIKPIANNNRSYDTLLGM